jgi:hypothetical protein
LENMGLAQAIDLAVEGSALVKVDRPHVSMFIGTGKVEELRSQIEANEISLVIMDCPLSPVQQRNLKRAWQAKVLDRIGLILEIFGRRARRGRAASRSSWRTWNISAAGWFVPGRIWDDSGADSASWEVQAKPKLSPIGVT